VSEIAQHLLLNTLEAAVAPVVYSEIEQYYNAVQCVKRSIVKMG